MKRKMVTRILGNGKKVRVAVAQGQDAQMSPEWSSWVWCTECPTQLPPDRPAIRKHFLDEHKIDPSHALYKAVLSNKECLNGVLPTGIVRKLPTDGVPDFDQMHSGRLRGEVSAGAYGTNRRK